MIASSSPVAEMVGGILLLVIAIPYLVAFRSGLGEKMTRWVERRSGESGGGFYLAYMKWQPAVLAAIGLILVIHGLIRSA